MIELRATKIYFIGLPKVMFTTVLSYLNFHIKKRSQVCSTWVVFINYHDDDLKEHTWQNQLQKLPHQFAAAWNWFCQICSYKKWILTWNGCSYEEVSRHSSDVPDSRDVPGGLLRFTRWYLRSNWRLRDSIRPFFGIIDSYCGQMTKRDKWLL